MNASGNTSTLPFGMKDGDNVRLMEFYTDSDKVTWFRATDGTVSLEGLRQVASEHRQHTGFCIDTAEYISQIGKMLFGLLQTPPEGSQLASFSYETGCGTRTFSETLDISFYGPIA